MPRVPAQYLHYMQRALDVAATTPPADVPVGAVIFDPHGQELAHATNRRETDRDPTAHAEILAIRHAARTYGDNWRLTDCTLAVTLEPCAMCAGAILGARVGRVIFGAYEPKTGCLGSITDLARETPTLHQLQVRGGILQPECEHLLTSFFNKLR